MIENFGTPDTLWILISAALVFFMQAGFKVLETGLVKEEHRAGIGLKNLMDWVAGSLAFFLIGFGLMFGTSSGGWLGTDLFGGFGLDDGYPQVFFIFQLAFAGTALTIVSGAMSGRTALGPYFITSLITAVIIYPIFGHWVWGNLLIETNKPWLAELGFMDFAGSTVVHSVGAWVGLVGIWVVGPRLGRYNAHGKIQPVSASDYAYSVLGLMILWLGWWGFNGGSTLAFDQSVPSIILNTNLAAAAACFSAYLHVRFFGDNKDVIEKIIGGALTGLVAITACCNVVSSLNSIVIGLLAGVIHNVSYILISEKWKLDDPVGAISVHGFGGVLGTLSVALFGKEELLAHDRWTQLGVQVLGVIVCVLFTGSIAYMMFSIIRRTLGLRLSPAAEIEGALFGTKPTIEELEASPEQQVHQVSARVGDRAYNLFTVEEYLSMPRETRLELVKTDSIQYLDDQGSIIPPLKAVRYMAGLIEQNKIEADLVETSLLDGNLDTIKGMQEVLIGDQHNIVSVFPNSFVFLKPQGKVSSDFYWHTKEKGYAIAITGICNNPDVSSAFLSAFSISQLNEIVGMKKILPPEQILSSLDEKLILAFQNKNKDQSTVYGLELGILLVDTNRRRVYYAGAGKHIKLYTKKLDGELVIKKGLDAPLGAVTKTQKVFERIHLDYHRGDSFFLVSEGFSNQLNEQGKRYTSAQLKDLISRNAGKSMLEQKVILMSELELWRGKEKQTEDVLILGVKP